MLYFLQSTWGTSTRSFIVFKLYVYYTVLYFSFFAETEAGNQYICCCAQ